MSSNGSSTEPTTTEGRSLWMKIFFVLAIGSVLLVLVAGVGIWWTVSRSGDVPEFYETAAVPTVESGERQRQAEQAEEAARNLLRQDPTTAVRESAPEQTESSGAPEQPVENAADVVFYESQINAFLATQSFGQPRDNVSVSDARVRLGDEAFKFGVRVDSPQYAGVVSGDVAAILLSPSSLRLDLTALRVGLLPIPAGTLVEQLGMKLPETFPGSIEVVDQMLRMEFDWADQEQVPLRLDALSIQPDGVRVRPIAR